MQVKYEEGDERGRPTLPLCVLGDCDERVKNGDDREEEGKGWEEAEE